MTWHAGRDDGEMGMWGRRGPGEMAYDTGETNIWSTQEMSYGTGEMAFELWARERHCLIMFRAASHLPFIRAWDGEEDTDMWIMWIYIVGSNSIEIVVFCPTRPPGSPVEFNMFLSGSYLTRWEQPRRWRQGMHSSHECYRPPSRKSASHLVTAQHVSRIKWPVHNQSAYYPHPLSVCWRTASGIWASVNSSRPWNLEGRKALWQRTACIGRCRERKLSNELDLCSLTLPGMSSLGIGEEKFKYVYRKVGIVDDFRYFLEKFSFAIIVGSCTGVNDEIPVQISGGYSAAYLKTWMKMKHRVQHSTLLLIKVPRSPKNSLFKQRFRMTSFFAF